MCSECGEENPARARFCLACATSLDADQEPVKETRKTVSVIFTDLVGSTALQEALDPESVRHVMGRFYDVMRAIVEDAGGRVDKFIGDAVVAVFGAPLVAEDDALRAVRAAAAMVDGLAVLNQELQPRWGVQLRMRTGVNTGEVVISRDGFMVGDTMNLAARLEQAAGEGEVLVGEETARLVRHDVGLDPIEPLSLKGKSGEVAAFRLRDVTDGEGHQTALEVPLIGRAAELERLDRVVDAALDSQACRLATVVASPGLGKTRLAHEFAARHATHAVILEARCEGAGQGTFAPVAEMTRDAAGIVEGDSVDDVRMKLGRLFGDDPDAAQIVARLAGVLGLADPSAPEETFWAVRRMLETAAAGHSAIVLIDDAHWAEPTFLDLIEYLLDWTRNAAIVLVLLARPEVRELRANLAEPSGSASEVIELLPLRDEESGQLVGSLLGEVEVPAGLMVQVLATTEGNPLFLGEMLRMLVDDGVLRWEADTWVVARETAFDVPPTINALLAARIDRLRAEERTVLERAAVIGRQFYRGAVAELTPAAVSVGIDGHLETLRRKDFVEPEGTLFAEEPVFRFHHVLIRDAAYRALLKEVRAELHERFADWLEDKAEELIGDHEELIGFHLEQAHSYRSELGPLDARGQALGRRAAQHLRSAGVRALGREDLPAAQGLLERAIDLLDAGTDRVEALVDLCEARISSGDTTVTKTAVAELRSLAQNPRLEALAAVFEGELANLTDRSHLQEVEGRLADAADVLNDVEDIRGVAKAHHVRAQTLALLGRVGDAEAALDMALGAARQSGDARRARAVLAGAPQAALWGPSPLPRASGRCLDVVRILRMRSGARHVEAVALRCQAVLEALRGRHEPAREILRTCRAMLEELGLTLELLETATYAGMVELIAGDPAAAEAELRGAYEGFTRLGVDAGAAHAAALLARAALETGDDEQAESLTRISEARGGEDLKTTVAWCSVRAQILAGRGEHEEADRFATRAVAIASETDALIDHADARLARAQVLRNAGRQDEARAEAKRARELYHRKESTAGEARARAFAGDHVSSQARIQPDNLATDKATSKLGAESEHGGFAGSGSTGIVRALPEALNARDWTRAGDLIAEDMRMIDHRPGSPIGELTGREAYIDFQRSAVALAADVRWSASIDVERGALFAGTLTVAGTHEAGGGPWRNVMGCLIELESSRISRIELFPEEARADLVGRLEELDREAQTALSQFGERYAAAIEGRDLDGVRSLLADTLLVRDHRPLSPLGAEIRGGDAYLRRVAALLEVADDLQVRIDLIEDRAAVGLARMRYGGRWHEGGGAYANDFLLLVVMEEELASVFEIYDPGDEAAARDRLEQLVGLTESGVESNSPGWDMPQRFPAALNARDWQAVAELVTENVVVVDHRPGSPIGVISGREAYVNFYKSAVSISADVQWIAELQFAEGQVIAGSLTVSGTYDDGGGSWRNVMRCRIELEDGLVARGDMFPEDTPASIVALGKDADRARSLELGRLWVEHHNARDWAAMRGLMCPDMSLVDHRRGLGGGETIVGRDAVVQRNITAVELVPDLRSEQEPLVIDEQGGIVRQVGEGHLKEGGGAVRLEFLSLIVIRDGLACHAELYDVEDLKIARRRFDELVRPPAHSKR